MVFDDTVQLCPRVQRNPLQVPLETLAEPGQETTFSEEETKHEKGIFMRRNHLKNEMCIHGAEVQVTANRQLGFWWLLDLL